MELLTNCGGVDDVLKVHDKGDSVAFELYTHVKGEFDENSIEQYKNINLTLPTISVIRQGNNVMANVLYLGQTFNVAKGADMNDEKEVANLLDLYNELNVNLFQTLDDESKTPILVAGLLPRKDKDSQYLMQENTFLFTRNLIDFDFTVGMQIQFEISKKDLAYHLDSDFPISIGMSKVTGYFDNIKNQKKKVLFDTYFNDNMEISNLISEVAPSLPKEMVDYALALYSEISDNVK